MSICDLINSSKDSSDAERAARTLLRRLQESDQRIVELSLTVSETCMKNCLPFSTCIEQPFMDEMVGITRGSKGQQNAVESLRLIQQWAKGFHHVKDHSPIFEETFRAMQTRGVSFPEDHEGAASFEIPPPALAATSSINYQSEFRSKDEEAFKKLETDLVTVFDKVKLCREMLRESPGIEEDEALAEVIGFLEACRDRMADVIEAGTQGLLNEELLARCFIANDAIFRTLEAEKNHTNISIEIDEVDRGIPVEKSNLLDFDDVQSHTKVSVAPASAVKAVMVDDDDFNSNLKSYPPPVPIQTSAPKLANNPFDENPFDTQDFPAPAPFTPNPPRSPQGQVFTEGPAWSPAPIPAAPTPAVSEIDLAFGELFGDMPVAGINPKPAGTPPPFKNDPEFDPFL